MIRLWKRTPVKYLGSIRFSSSKLPKEATAPPDSVVDTNITSTSPLRQTLAAQERRKKCGIALEVPSGTFSDTIKEEVLPHILLIVDKFDQLEQMAREGNTKNADLVATQISVLQQREVTRLILKTFLAHPLRRTLLGNLDLLNTWAETSDDYLWEKHPDGHSFFEPPYNQTISPSNNEFKDYEEDFMRIQEHKDAEYAEGRAAWDKKYGSVMKKVGGRMKVDREAAMELKKLRK